MLVRQVGTADLLVRQVGASDLLIPQVGASGLLIPQVGASGLLILRSGPPTCWSARSELRPARPRAGLVRGEDSSRRSFGRPRGNLPAHPPPQGGQAPRARLTAVSLPSGLTLRVAPEYGIALCYRDPAHGQVTPSGLTRVLRRVPSSACRSQPLTGRMRAASLQSGSKSLTRAHAGQISPIRFSVTHPGPCGPRFSNPVFSRAP